MLDIEYNVRMFLFARWMAVQYPSAVLNTENGLWWKEQIMYFNDKVIPVYLKNGTFYNARHFMDPKYELPHKSQTNGSTEIFS